MNNYERLKNEIDEIIGHYSPDLISFDEFNIKLRQGIKQAVDKGQITKEEGELLSNEVSSKLEKKVAPKVAGTVHVYKNDKLAKPVKIDKKASASKKQAKGLNKCLVAVVLALGLVLGGLGGGLATNLIKMPNAYDYDQTRIEQMTSEDFMEIKQVKDACELIINNANEARKYGIDITAEEAIALYCGMRIESDTIAQQLATLVFASPNDLNNYLNSATTKISNAQFYGVAVDYSSLFVNEKDQATYKKFNDIVSKLLVAENKTSLNQELNSFLRETFGYGSDFGSDAMQRAIMHDVFSLKALQGISLDNDLDVLFFKDNDKIPNCNVPGEYLDNLYNEQTSENKSSINYAYEIDIFSRNGIQMSFEERQDAKEEFVETVRDGLIELGMTPEEIEAAKLKYGLVNASKEAPKNNGPLVSAGDRIENVGGHEVIVEPGENKSPGLGAVVEEKVEKAPGVSGDTTKSGSDVDITLPNGDTITGEVNGNNGTEDNGLDVMTPEQIQEMQEKARQEALKSQQDAEAGYQAAQAAANAETINSESMPSVAPAPNEASIAPTAMTPQEQLASLTQLSDYLKANNQQYGIEDGAKTL